MIVDAFLFIGKLLETCGLIGGLSMEIKLILGEINADRSWQYLKYCGGRNLNCVSKEKYY